LPGEPTQEGFGPLRKPNPIPPLKEKGRLNQGLPTLGSKPEFPWPPENKTGGLKIKEPPGTWLRTLGIPLIPKVG